MKLFAIVHESPSGDSRGCESPCRRGSSNSERREQLPSGTVVATGDEHAPDLRAFIRAAFPPVSGTSLGVPTNPKEAWRRFGSVLVHRHVHVVHVLLEELRRDVLGEDV